jgi:hypothetical protein
MPICIYYRVINKTNIIHTVPKFIEFHIKMIGLIYGVLMNAIREYKYILKFQNLAHIHSTVKDKFYIHHLKYFNQKYILQAGDVAQEVEHLPSKC